MVKVSLSLLFLSLLFISGSTKSVQELKEENARLKALMEAMANNIASLTDTQPEAQGAGTTAALHSPIPNTANSKETLDQCSQQSLTKHATNDIKIKQIYDEISPRFPTLAVKEGEKRCLQRAPPWDPTCPCSSYLDLAEMRLDDPPRAIEAIEKAAKAMIGDENKDPKMLHYPRIEYYMWKIAEKIMIPSPKVPNPKTVKKVLHVATELFHTGGHTKVIPIPITTITTIFSSHYAIPSNHS